MQTGTDSRPGIPGVRPAVAPCYSGTPEAGMTSFPEQVTLYALTQLPRIPREAANPTKSLFNSKTLPGPTRDPAPHAPRPLSPVTVSGDWRWQ